MGFPGVYLVTGDVCDLGEVRRAMEGCSEVFHLAASVGNRRSLEDPVHDTHANLIGTLSVLEASRQGGVDAVVVSSSAAVLGELKAIPIGEDHPLDPETPYGVSKLAMEKMVIAYSRLYGIPVVALRYFNVYGPAQRFDAYGNAIPIFATQLMNDQPVTIYGDGEQTRDFVSVHDVVRANLLAARAARGISPLVANIGSGTRVSINSLVGLMRELTGSSSLVQHGAERPGDVRDSLADITTASRALGYCPSVDLRTGLREYVDWLRSAEAH